MFLPAQAFTEFNQAFWTIAIAAACAVPCAILGAFLLLKRMSLLGDAISHGILPGIAVAVLMTGSRVGVFVLVGAMLFGFLTAFLSQALHSFGKVTEDASLGVVFTALFAFGVILITRFLSHVDLDPKCIFFGLLDGAFMRTTTWFGLAVPRVFPMQLLSLFLTLGFVCLFWKELKLATFDPALAAAMGFRPNLVHFTLIALVAGSTVSAFEAVGSILVLAMLVVPPATGLLLTDCLAPLLCWSAGLAFSSAFFAYYLSAPAVFDSNVAGMMAVVSGVQFLLALLAAPRHGLVAQYVRHVRLTLRIAADEVLASLYRSEEGAPTALPEELQRHGIASIWVGLARWRLRRLGLIAQENGVSGLTPRGRAAAEEVVRAHRLWESYLDRNFDLPPDHLHEPASRVEHYIGPELRKQIARQLDEPAADPHGRAIPKGE